MLADPRFAGEVKRYHTWPCLQVQTVASHTWHVMRIYWQLFGPMPPVVSTHLLWHDAGELRAGDLPFPVKANNPKLKAEIERLELDTLAGMQVKLPPLSEREKVRCKLCDLLEMYDFGLVERALGNSMSAPIIDDINLTVGVLVRNLPKQERQPIWDYMMKLSRRFE